MHRRLANQLEQFGAGARAHDRLVGRAEGGEHAGEAVPLLVGRATPVRLIEIIEGERDVLGEPLQQLDEFGREGVLFRGDKDQDAHHLAAVQQRQRRTGFGVDVGVARYAMKGGAALVGQIVVADAGLTRAKRRPGQPASLGMVGRDRKSRDLGRFRARPCRRGDAKKVFSRLRHADNGGIELAAMHRGLANQLEQFGARAGMHDGFVRRAKGGEHPGQAFLGLVGRAAAAGRREARQGQGDILRQPAQPFGVRQRRKHPPRTRLLRHASPYPSPGTMRRQT